MNVVKCIAPKTKSLTKWTVKRVGRWSAKHQRPQAFDEVNRETGGWAMTMREAKEPVMDGQVENERHYTKLI